MKQIVIIGDEVCADYCPVVKSSLKEYAQVWCPELPVNSTFRALEGLGEWVLKRQPDVVFLAAGLGDTRRLCVGDEERLVPLPVFERNARWILRLIRERCTATAIWATITPVDRRRIAGDAELRLSFGYDNDTISLYNEEAQAVAKSLGAQTLDLYGCVKAAARIDSRRPDGLRFDERGSDYLAARVTKALRAACA